MIDLAEELNRGWRIHQSGGHVEAERIYREVVRQQPTNANAWCYLGMACHDQDRWSEAIQCYRKAIQLQPVFPIAFNNLGNSLRLLRRLDESVAAFDEALRQRPGYVNALKNKGTALLWEGHVEAAESAYRAALALADGDAEVRKNLGVIELLTGRFAVGWPNYESRFDAVPGALPRVAAPRWDGSPLAGRTIVLAAEQGMGDTLHFARYATWLKRREPCRVILYCQASLGPLLASLADVDLIAPNNLPAPPCDVWAPLVSVPGLVGHVSTADFPAAISYLDVPAERLRAWSSEVAAWGGVKIGIAWQGNAKFQADRYRSVPLAVFEPLGKLHGVTLVSLQKGVGEEQLDSIGDRFDVVPLGPQLDTSGGAFLDTAAVMKQLDLVVSVDTSTAHLAGALGVPVWLALSRVPDWRWLLDGDDSAWYPTARLFRQEAIGEWGPVFERIAAEICRRFPQARPRRPEEHRLASTGRHRLVRARHGLMLFNRHDMYIGRSLDRYGEFSEGEIELFRQIVRPGGVVVEAGANFGAHTVPLARMAGPAGKVVAFEPQRLVFQALCGNLALNSLANVEARCEAVGAEAGWTCVPPLDYDRENNFGGLSLDQAGSMPRGEQVRLTTIDSLELPRCDLLKVDVEGMELPVLQGARQTLERCKPALYVENDRRDRSPRLIQFLLDADYELYWHLPPMFNPANAYGEAHNEFPQIVSVNMLCVPRSAGAQIVGLRRVEGPDGNWQAES